MRPRPEGRRSGRPVGPAGPATSVVDGPGSCRGGGPGILCGAAHSRASGASGATDQRRRPSTEPALTRSPSWPAACRDPCRGVANLVGPGSPPGRAAVLPPAPALIALEAAMASMRPCYGACGSWYRQHCRPRRLCALRQEGGGKRRATSRRPGAQRQPMTPHRRCAGRTRPAEQAPRRTVARLGTWIPKGHRVLDGARRRPASGPGRRHGGHDPRRPRARGRPAAPED